MLKGLGKLWLQFADEKRTLQPPASVSSSLRGNRVPCSPFDSTVLRPSCVGGGRGTQSALWGQRGEAEGLFIIPLHKYVCHGRELQRAPSSSISEASSS